MSGQRGHLITLRPRISCSGQAHNKKARPNFNDRSNVPVRSRLKVHFRRSNQVCLELNRKRGLGFARQISPQAADPSYSGSYQEKCIKELNGRLTLEGETVRPYVQSCMVTTRYYSMMIVKEDTQKKMETKHTHSYQNPTFFWISYYELAKKLF